MVTNERPDPPALFIIGAARSGTSLLYKALCLHPEAAYVSNYIEHFPQLPGLAVLNRIPRRFPSVRQKVWFGDDSNAYVYGRRRALAHRMFPMPVEGESLFRRAGFHESPADNGDFSGEQRRRLLRYVATIRRTAGSRVFISKRIANGRRVPQLLEALPKGRFVSITRDGRAVAYSLSQVNWWDNSVVWWYGSTPQQWHEEGRDPWVLCARNWVEEVRAIESAAHTVPAEQFLSLRYEELVANPVNILERIAEFAGLSPSGTWSQTIASLRYSDRNERWRTQLPSPIVHTIEDIQSQTLARYGYL